MDKQSTTLEAQKRKKDRKPLTQKMERQQKRNGEGEQRKEKIGNQPIITDEGTNKYYSTDSRGFLTTGTP